MPPGLAFERLTFLPVMVWEFLTQQDEAGAGRADPLVIHPFTLTLCLPGVGMCLFSVTDWLFCPKNLAVSGS